MDALKIFEAAPGRKATPKSRGANLFCESAPTQVKNPHGYTAYSDSFYGQVFRILQCGVYKAAYYGHRDLETSEARDALATMALSDPKWLLKCAIMARKNNMKIGVKLAIVALSANADFCKQYEKSICSLLATFHPKQLREYVEMQKHYKRKGFGYRQQRWIGSVIDKWIADGKLSKYSVSYKKDFQILMRLSHKPKVENKGLHYVFDKQEGTPKGLPHTTLQRAAEKFKDMSARNVGVNKLGRFVIENKIPFNLSKIHSYKDKASEAKYRFALLSQMGEQATLLNTRSLKEAGVFEIPGAIDFYRAKVVQYGYKHSRVNPLDVIKAWHHNSDRDVRAVLEDSLVNSFKFTIPGLEDEKVHVGIDISGSMRKEGVQLANMLGYGFFGKAKKTTYSWFDHHVYVPGGVYKNGHDSRARYFANWNTPSIKAPTFTGDAGSDIHTLLQMNACGATWLSGPLEIALANGHYYDKIVLITDEQQNAGSNLYDVWKQYKTHINPKAHLILVNASNYKWRAADDKDESVTLFNTMSPTIFQTVGWLGKHNIRDMVDKVQLWEETSHE